MSINNKLLKSLGFCCYFMPCLLSAAEEVEDFFDMTLAELAATPISIGSGSLKPISQSPAVASVITADQIKTMGATELHEVLETVPGIHASVQGLTGDYNYSVRGIQNTTNSELLILMNGTRITTPFRGTLMSTTELPLEAIQQIEVIRGPGSALYGADAFAGVINIITKKTKDIDGFNTGVRAGKHNTQSGWGQYGGSWAGWEIASSLQYQRTDGDMGRILKSDSQTLFDQRLGTSASLAPGPMNTQYEIYNGNLNLKRKYWDIGLWASSDQSGTRAGVYNALDPQGHAGGQQYLADARFSTQDWFEDWELAAHASYLYNSFQMNAQSFPNNALLPIGSDGNVNPASRNLVFFPNGLIRNIGESDQIPAFELSAVYKGFNKHLFSAKAGFRHEQTSTSQQSNIGSNATNGTQSIVDGTLMNVSGTSLALFPNLMQRSVWSAALQDEWRLTDNWQLTAGVRLDDYSDFGTTVNPRAALVWDINKKMTTKWLYGKAFRAPSFTELYTKSNIALLGNPNLKPETIESYEWAFDYHPLSTLRTAANFYYYSLDDLISLVPDTGVASSTFQNIGDQKAYGAEFEGNWQINESWSVSGNYAWQHAVDQRADARVPGVPEHHVYTAMIWHFLPKWQMQSQFNWVGSRSNAISRNGALSDYQTLDFTLRGIKLFGHINIAASLRNAFDTIPYEPASLPIGTNLPMPGRSFYLEASFHF